MLLRAFQIDGFVMEQEYVIMIAGQTPRDALQLAMMQTGWTAEKEREEDNEDKLEYIRVTEMV